MLILGAYFTQTIGVMLEMPGKSYHPHTAYLYITDG